MITTTENDIKERLSVGYVALVAARAGCMLQDVHVDRDSIDVTIRPVSGEPVCIDAQLKATSTADREDDNLLFDLPIKNYNDLRSHIVGNARILIVLDLHHDSEQWTSFEGESLVTRRLAYWTDLYGEPATTNLHTKRVRLPFERPFTPTGLRHLMQLRYDKILANDGGVL